MLRPDTIDSPKQGIRALGISSRPVVWIGGLFGGLGLLAFVITSEEPTAEARGPGKDAAQILAPDRTTASDLAARHAASQQPPKSGGLQPPLETRTLPPPPPAGDSLGVTDSVPLVVDDGSEAPPLANTDDVRRAERTLLARDRIERLRDQLARRRAAYDATPEVESFAAARRARGEEAAAFLDGVGRPSGEEDPSMMGMESESLRALAAMPAAALKMAEGHATAGGQGGGDGSDPSGQATKNEFFRRGGDQLRPAELDSAVKKSKSPYRILMGWKIPGTLETGINSEGPGPITGTVREDVFDTASGQHLLIPHGSQLVGTYSSAVSQGQRRVQVAWVRINFPNGDTLDLDGMPGVDQAGVSGFSHEVDTHWGKRLAGALLASIFAVGFEATMPTNRLAFESSLHRGVGESLTQWGMEEARRLGQQPPTLKIPAGYKFTIFATKDVTFAGPYRDAFTTSKRRR